MASFMLAWRNKRLANGLMFLGAMMWLFGNVAVYRGSDSGLVLSLPGEALFFLSLPIAMYISTKQIRWLSFAWQTIAVITAMGVTIRIGTALTGENLTETEPLTLILVMTMYAISFLLLLWATMKRTPSLIKKPPL